MLIVCEIDLLNDDIPEVIEVSDRDCVNDLISDCAVFAKPFNENPEVESLIDETILVTSELRLKLSRDVLMELNILAKLPVIEKPNDTILLYV